MSVKMIASRRHYVKVDLTEYGKGESFMVADDREADRLVRMKRATRAVVAAKSGTRTKSRVAAEPAPTAAAQSGELNLANQTVSEVGTYGRRDMRAQD